MNRSSAGVVRAGGEGQGIRPMAGYPAGAGKGRGRIARMVKSTYIEEEILIIRDYGEMPEVGYHGSLYFLSEDPEGPGLALSGPDHHCLKLAVVAGYLRIVRRDLEPDNRSKGLYRGLHRCALNWQRLVRFCRREGLETVALGREVGELLRAFVALELAEFQAGKHPSAVNCPAPMLSALARELGLGRDELPRGWEALCPER